MTPAHQFRITKYDPALRNAAGHYVRPEWTSFSDVGRDFGGVVLAMPEYERVESAYLDAAFAFLREANEPRLRVRGLENAAQSDSAPAEELEGERLRAAFRAVLREEFWCRFESPSAFVHFGWDYYMYVGVRDECGEAQARARALGLYVEDYPSPYPCGEDG
jgi:hypothetical protein